MAFPTHAKYLIVVGAGIHGLSTAYHLALQLNGLSGQRQWRDDILVIDKSGIASGASGHRLRCRAATTTFSQPCGS